MRRGILILLLFLLLPAPVYGANVGTYRAEFKAAVKQKKVILRKAKVGKTVLYYDTKLPKKRVKAVKKMILYLPAKVQKTAKKVYFLRKKIFALTLRPGLPADTVGYAILDGYQEIYIYGRGSAAPIRSTLYHEFGHTYDSRKKTYGTSSGKKWKKIVKTYIGGGDPHEWYADIFAAFFELFRDQDYDYIRRSLNWT